jgi:ParB family chromosome partitioning protein
MVPVASIEPHPGQPRRIFQEEALGGAGRFDPGARRRPADHRPAPRPSFPDRRRRAPLAGGRSGRGCTRFRPSSREFSDEETLEVALIENIQREDLNAIEEAQAYKRLSTITATPRKSSASSSTNRAAMSPTC